MKENKNIAFLDKIYKTSEMGVIGINDVIDKVKQSKFREFLEEQKKEYTKILEECEKIFPKYGTEEQEISKMTRISSKVMSDMMIKKESEDKTIAEMMVKGTSKGITKIIEAINLFDDGDEEITKLGEDLLKTLENNIKGLKVYL
ncbi:MAG: hypothetical protein HFJ02_01215 [Bacilli bacterium]|nr:hypothetical protein [Bacilli bacterium]